MFYFLIFSTCICFSQTKKIDSLWTVYKNTAEVDTNRLKAINIIAEAYKNNNPDTAIILAKEELILANTLDSKKGKEWAGNAINTIGKAHMNKGDYTKALDYFFKALQIFQEVGDKNGAGYSYTNMANVHGIQSNYPKALEFSLKALKLLEETNDKNGVGNCYNNIGNIYADEFNYDKALSYYLKALKIREEIRNKKGIASSYFNIGTVYVNIASLKNNKATYKKALDYFLRALKLKEELGDKQGIANCYSNIGSVYLVDLNYKNALEYFLKSLALRQEIGDAQGTTSSYICLSDLYNKTNNYKLSILFCDSALQIAKEINDITNQRLAYQNLAEAYEKIGKYKEAYQSEVEFKTLTDSIFNTENSKQLGDLKTQFEVEKKEAELKVKAEAQAIINLKEKKSQLLVIYSAIGVLSVVIVFSIFLYRRFKITQRQKTIIEEQKHLVEEHQKEIIDSINYAERIQRSFIATKEILNENLNDYFVFFKPKDIVSGDFYWASKLNNGNFALATADSTGHGVPGAIMSLLNVTSLESAIKDGFTSPAEILNDTRKTIIERLKKDGSSEGGKDGMDCSLCVYDFKNHKLIVASAHNPVWIVRGQETIEIKPDKMPVGKHDKDNISFTQQEIELKSGDVVYTLTDGFPDQFGGEKGKKFMSKNLRELLSTNARLPMHEQKKLLEKTFSNWVGNLEQVDDVTLIGVRI